MVIGIDIRVLGSKTKSGIEEYTENLLAHLLPLNTNIKFKLFFSSQKAELPDYDWLHLPNVELKKFRIPNKLMFASTYLFNTPLIDKLIGGVDIFFSPHFLLTSLSPECKRVTTFHDLSYVHFPEFFSWRRHLWHGVEMRPGWQSKFSDRLIAVSESTKSDLIKVYDIDPAKIKVIYSGISSGIRRPADEMLSEFREKNNLPNKFVLFLGKLEPRKNITGLIRAFELVKKDNNFDDLYLAIVGSPGWLYKDIFKQISSSPFKDKIILKNYISDSERPFYYSLASLFVYPSFFEGFGFPPLEAMACGTPVVVSNRSSLPEVAGDCGLLVNPNSISETALAIKSVLGDQAIGDKLSSAGLERARQFSWQSSAEETLKTLVG